MRSAPRESSRLEEDRKRCDDEERIGSVATRRKDRNPSHSEEDQTRFHSAATTPLQVGARSTPGTLVPPAHKKTEIETKGLGESKRRKSPRQKKKEKKRKRNESPKTKKRKKKKKRGGENRGPGLDSQNRKRRTRRTKNAVRTPPKKNLRQIN
jgi:hypothetical protein